MNKISMRELQRYLSRHLKAGEYILTLRGKPIFKMTLESMSDIESIEVSDKGMSDKISKPMSDKVIPFKRDYAPISKGYSAR